MSEIDPAEIVAAAGDAIVVSDAEGRIVVWNAAATRIFGYAEAEALGQSLDIITPERHRKRHWEGYHKTVATGVTKYGADVLRVPAITKAGGTLSIAFTVALLRDADGKVSGVLAVMRDETKRFKEERDLKQRIAELEAQARKA
ncbi:MAG: PAS domain S-box protein [Hyphomicrobiales bacterium]|nr:MAG: PAS domain S-box protein [Hyphomicrobiales bacterium]